MGSQDQTLFKLYSFEHIVQFLTFFIAYDSLHRVFFYKHTRLGELFTMLVVTGETLRAWRSQFYYIRQIWCTCRFLLFYFLRRFFHIACVVETLQLYETLINNTLSHPEVSCPVECLFGVLIKFVVLKVRLVAHLTQSIGEADLRLSQSRQNRCKQHPLPLEKLYQI